MTREESISKAQSIHEQHKFIKLIAKIHDDFESRTCSNCKYENKITMSGGARTCLLLDIGIGKDFGCNKWEAKEK